MAISNERLAQNIAQYSGLSTDIKPTSLDESKFFETDTNRRFISHKGVWYPDYSIAQAFEISAEITRATNTTTYSAGQIINGNGLTDLIDLDFSAIAIPNQKIQLISCSILDEFGTAATKLVAQVYLFNTDTLTGSNLADAQAFIPTYAELKAKRVATFEDVSILTTFGTSAYMISQTEVSRICSLNANSKLFAAIIASTAYTSGNGKKLTLVIKGFLL
jgi:hypothetical protein